jgi:hypothetical protein
METMVPLFIVIAPAIAFAIGATVESRAIGAALVSLLPLGLAASSLGWYLFEANRYGDWLLAIALAFATAGWLINLACWAAGRAIVSIENDEQPGAPLPVYETWRTRHWGDSGIPGGVA